MMSFHVNKSSRGPTQPKVNDYDNLSLKENYLLTLANIFNKQPSIALPRTSDQSSVSPTIKNE